MAPPGRIPFLEQLYFHVALPRNIHGTEDSNIYHIEDALLARLLDAVARLTPHVLPEHLQRVRGLREILLACQTLNVEGTTSKPTLLKEFRNLGLQKMLVLHTSPQNCALFVYMT